MFLLLLQLCRRALWVTARSGLPVTAEPAPCLQLCSIGLEASCSDCNVIWIAEPTLLANGKLVRPPLAGACISRVPSIELFARENSVLRCEEVAKHLGQKSAGGKMAESQPDQLPTCRKLPSRVSAADVALQRRSHVCCIVAEFINFQLCVE